MVSLSTLYDFDGGGGSGPPPANNHLAGLLAYWSMDEASGTRVDSHTNGFDLTDNNTVGSVAGIINNAADFVAANSEYLQVADDPLLRFNDGDYTISFWINCATLPTDETGSYYLFQKDTAANRGFGITYISNIASSDNGGRGIAVVVGSGGGSRDFITVILKSSLSAATWMHLVIVKRTIGQSLIGYVDGVVDNSEIYTVTAGNDPTSPLTVAADNFTGVPTNFWDCAIDEVGIWNRALTDHDITLLYNSGAGTPYADFVTGGPSFV